MDCRAARSYLEELGIEYVDRKTDSSKGYGESITLDLTTEVAPGSLRRLSVRGTVTEGNLMVSRIDEFDKLYFEPFGHTAFFLYEDRPGVIGTIGVSLAAAGINIADMRNPNNPRTNRSLAIMKISEKPSEDVMKAISEDIQALSAFSVKL